MFAVGPVRYMARRLALSVYIGKGSWLGTVNGKGWT